MRAIVVGLALLGILLITGCSQAPSTEPVWGNCGQWQVCDLPEKTTYNITASDCLTLDGGNAQALWGLLMKHNIKMVATCLGNAS